MFDMTIVTVLDLVGTCGDKTQHLINKNLPQSLTWGMLVIALQIFLHKTSLQAQTISLAIMSTQSPKQEKTSRAFSYHFI